MICQYNVYSFCAKRFIRRVLFVLTPGVVTILCHAQSLIQSADLRQAVNTYVLTIADDRPRFTSGLDDVFIHGHAVLHGPAPIANDDQAHATEEIPVAVNVLANDTSGLVDDEDDEDDEDEDDGDNDFAIDPRTVDLNTEMDGIQSSLATSSGIYTANESGHVTFSPSLNFFGNTAIKYTVRSNEDEVSNRATLAIAVSNVNDVPVITGAAIGGLSAVAGQPVTLTLSLVTVIDPDNNPSDLAMTINSGNNYTVSGNTITPDPDFSGNLPVVVQVTDGLGVSAPFTLNLSVTRANVKPVITGQVQTSIAEDQSFVMSSEYLVVSDADNEWPGDFTIHVGPGEKYTVSGQTITPELNFSGELKVPVIVNDGEIDSDPFDFILTVTAVNDRPVITGQSPDPLPAAQNQSFTLAVTNVTVTDPDNTFPDDFTLEVSEGPNYSFSGTTVTPAQSFSGALVVNVVVNDGTDRSDPFAFKVNVAPNAPPVIDGQASELSTLEETSLAISLANLIVSDPDNSPQELTLTIQPGIDYSVAEEIITPAVDFAGVLTVPVTVSDGVNTSAPFNLSVTVTNVNDAPRITAHAPLTVPEGQSITLDLSHLTVSDPDSEILTLSILPGDYAVEGNVITPRAGFSGELKVPVTVSDGEASSEEFLVTIIVTPVNDPPRITGQRSIVIAEGSALTLSLSDVTIEDPDNTGGFTLMVLEGADYSFQGTTVTPHADFSGQLTINIAVSDGASTSEVYALAVTVTPVNDPPVITGQAAISIDEDTPRTIDFGDLIVSDPDNTYPSGYTLTLSPGAHYTIVGNVLTPEANYSGPLTVQVQVNDGTHTSNVFPLAITVLAVNDKPSVTGQVPLETTEDTPVTILPSHLTVLDVDNSYPSGFSVIISPGANYTVSGTTITPSQDFNGTLNVGVVVNDGLLNSDLFIFQIQVGNTNDAPMITGQAAVSTDEEKPVNLALSHLTVSDPDNPFPAGFTLIISPGTNYTVEGLTITPTANFAGVLTVPVRVNDGVNNSPTFDLKLQVNEVNDPPSFAAIASQRLAENTPAGSVTITGISKGPMEDYQQVTFVASSSNAAVIEQPVIQYDGTGSTAVLSYVIKPNASGVVTITVVAIDNGSNTPPNQNSYTSSFQVDVTEINTAPTLNAINHITVMEDAEQQNVPLTGISAGAGESQIVTVAVSTNKPEFFDILTVAYTSPSDNGLLQFKVKPNVSGMAEISVTVTDNGSGVAPHVNTIAKKFSVVIQPVNDAPVFTSAPVRVAVLQEDYVYAVTATDPDGENVTISATVKPAWLTLSNPGNNGRATLSGRPPAGVLGEVGVTLQVKDAVMTVEQSFAIYVNVRPALSSISVVTEEDTSVTFQADFFAGGYTDLNENPLQSVSIMTLPAAGKLFLAETEVHAGDTIIASALSDLSYRPDLNYFGTDAFAWNAFDGYHFSRSPARVNISVLSINDAPKVLLQEDTLKYEVNGEAALVSPLIDIIDPDDDTLTYVAVKFSPRSYRPDMDLLDFQATATIRGMFDFQSGVLQFTGAAPLAEYRNALRSVRYLYQNTVDPILEPKGLEFMVSDGESESAPTNMVIMLQYTFVEFEIPSGFTPNGDHTNDTWIIDRPGGGLQEMTNAVISVYNKHGVLVYRARGFKQPWDGTSNGEILPADTYFYTIDLQLRNNKTYKGIITILR